MSSERRSWRPVVLAASFYVIISLCLPIPLQHMDQSSFESSSFVSQEDQMRANPRFDFLMAYDSMSDQIIIWGGFGDTQFQSSSIRFDTWSYDLLTNTFSDHTASIHPPATIGAAMAYDSESDRIVLYTGIDYNGFSPRETWIYDYDQNLWSDMTSSTRPSNERSGHSVAYDAESDKIILFGGRETYRDPYRVQYVWFNDTWSYDLRTNSWTEMKPENRPAARANHRMVYDAESDRVILFGGESENREQLLDTWAYDFNTDSWEILDTSPSPSPRSYHSMSYDSEADRIVIIGGYDLGNRLNDTWAFDYNTKSWTQKGEIPYSTGIYGHNAVYHAGTNLITVFGGFSGDVKDATWIYSAKKDIWFDGTHSTDDSDDDALADLVEHDIGTQWFNPDSDFDLMSDGWEYRNGLDPLDPSDADLDFDDDGLTNLEEFQSGTNPNLADSDADSYSDKWEIENGFNPVEANSPILPFMVSNLGAILFLSISTPIASFSIYVYRLHLKAQYAKQLAEEETNAIRRAFRDLVDHARRSKDETG